MGEYKSNSDKSKKMTAEPQNNVKPPAKKVISGKAKLKKTANSKFRDTFIASSAADVKDYIVNDIVIPTIKKTLYDIFVNGLGLTLFGEARGDKQSRPGSNVSYVKYYDERNGYRRDSYVPSYRTRSGYSYSDVIVDTRGEAEELLDRMVELINGYGIASVLDLYDMAGLNTYTTDNDYGWTRSAIRDAQIIRDRDGWRLKMPRPQPIN